MKCDLAGFRKFVLEEMDPSMSKKIDSAEGQGGEGSTQDKDYFFGLGDEFGMEWDDLAKALESDPWISTHFQLGADNMAKQYKASSWKIVPDSLTPNGADIMLVNPGRAYLPGKRLDKSNEKDGRRYHLNRKQLIDFLTKGWTPALQQQQPMM